MTLSSAMQTLSAWSRDVHKAFSLDLRRNPAPTPAPKPKTDTRAAHYALKAASDRVHAELRQAAGR